MGKKELSGRATWQDYSGQNAGVAEKSFLAVMQKAFKGTDFRVREKPREFNNIYREIDLHPSVLKQIYTPPHGNYTHGIIPDYAIDNVKTDEHLYVEVKRQDGWVKGKEMSAGRGNAHERSCKLFTPGLLKILRNTGHLGHDVLPFWVFTRGTSQGIQNATVKYIVGSREWNSISSCGASPATENHWFNISTGTSRR